MPTKTLPAVKWENWKQIKHSMYLEGWLVDDEDLKQVAKGYEGKGYSEAISRAKEIAIRTGQSVIEVGGALIEELRIKMHQGS